LNISRLQLSELIDGIRRSDRIVLSKAITLVESALRSDQELAAQLMDAVLPFTGNSIRIAITGVPGVGKSTFIEAFGKKLIHENKKLAVLTIDPASHISKGSILGDKTRMEELSKHKSAFVRPSSSGEKLGGVGNKTREAILLCEAAGFDVIIVETVGVGQSEVEVKNMVDFFLLLMLAGAGDELQGMKKGIMEMADAVVITKADGDNVGRATEAQAEYQQALHFLHTSNSRWTPMVLTCSAVTNSGIDEVWNIIKKYKETTTANGYFGFNRSQQNIAWFNDHFHHLLKNDLSNFEDTNRLRKSLEEDINDQKLSPAGAAHKLLHHYYQEIKKKTS
jgi:LAO/AO transport system kinase